MRYGVALILTLCTAERTVAQTTEITVYNQGFAVVKERRTIDLARGETDVRITDVTAHLEPESVIVRDVRAQPTLRILEQNYESDPLSQSLLLKKFEGREIDFEIALLGGGKQIVPGRILRSGYAPHPGANQRYGRQYAQTQALLSNPQGGGQPIVEVDGKIVFGLPGKPRFDAIGPEAVLKPTLLWRLFAAEGGAHEIELSYVTGGMRWEATYNAVASEAGDRFDLSGWVTLENMSGKDFEGARLKLMAGDVARVDPGLGSESWALRTEIGGGRGGLPEVSQRSFDEYHLYTLERRTTLLDRELKQVEFLRADDVPARRLYVYEGALLDRRFHGYDLRNHPDYGIQSNPRVWTMMEFRNDEASRLGIPLPQGVVKVYRRGDADGENEFIGEDELDHTPKDEVVRLYLGNAFDLVGGRKRTHFERSDRTIVESFEISVRNHKDVETEVRVVERLYRWLQWELAEQSMESTEIDAQTIEFRPAIAPGGEATIRYTVRYSW